MTHLLSGELGLQSDNFLFNGRPSRLPGGSRGQQFIFSLNQGRLPFRNSCPAVWLNLAHKSKNCLALFIRLALPCSALRCFANGDLSQLLQSLESFLCNWSQPELEAKIYKLLSAAKWCLHTNSLTCPCITVGPASSANTKTTKFV